MTQTTSQLRVLDEAVPFIPGGILRKTIPDEGVSKIIVIFNADGTPQGGSTGSYESNTAIENLVLRINGEEFISWKGGEDRVASPSFATLALREFYKMNNNGKEMPTNSWIIDLPDALSRLNEVILISKMGSLNSILSSGHDRTGYTGGTIDIYYEAKDKIEGQDFVPYINYELWDFDNISGTRHRNFGVLPYPLRTIIMITDDDGSLSDALFNKLTLALPGKNIWEGTPNLLKTEFTMRTGQTLDTGYFFKSFKEGLYIPPDSFRWTFDLVAGTDKQFYLLYIAY